LGTAFRVERLCGRARTNFFDNRRSG
jgi:hypothetical protein